MIIIAGADYYAYIERIKEEPPTGGSLFLYPELNKIKSVKRKKEIVATHKLLRRVTKNDSLVINHTTVGKPYVNGFNKQISISHCKNFISLAVSDKKTGIDIETISSKALIVKNKFISEEEISIWGELNNVSATLLWSAKEAVYKIDNNLLDFKNMLKLIDVTRISKFRGKIRFNNISIDYFIFDNFVVCVAINKKI